MAIVYAPSSVFVRTLSPVIVQAKPGRLPQVSASIRSIDLTRVLSFGPFKGVRPWASSAFTAARAIPAFNMHAAVLDGVSITQLAQSPDVAAIYPDNPVRISQFPYVPPAGTWSVEVPGISGFAPVPMNFTSTQWTRRLLGADVANAAGYSGQGVKACVVDTGGHLHPQTRRAGFLTAIPGVVVDVVSHGQWCLAALGGTSFKDTAFSAEVGAPVYCEGMAPLCGLLAVKALDFVIGTAPTSILLSGLAMALAQKVDVLSLSWGSPVSTQTPEADPFYPAMQALDAAGILVFAAAGNAGPGSSTLDSPGALPQPVTVGGFNAVPNGFNTMFGPGGEMCNFSSRGPAPWGAAKPDCVAPGAIIDSGVSAFSQMAVSYTQRPHEANAIAGCVHEDSLVWLVRGAVPIRDVVAGDLAWGFDGSRVVPVRVALNLRRGRQGTVVVRTESRTVCVTPNHPLLVARLSPKESDPGDFSSTSHESNTVPKMKGYQPLDRVVEDKKRLKEMYPTATWDELHAAFPYWSRDWMRHMASEIGVRRTVGTQRKAPLIRFVWVEASNIRRGDVLVYPRSRPAVGEGHPIGPEFARLLGFMVGDGWTTGTNHQTAFALSRHEDLNKRYLDLFEGATGCRPTVDKRGKQAYVYSRDIWRRFRSLGMSDKASGKHTPSPVWVAPPSEQSAYLAGLFEADGYEGEHRSGLEMCNRSLISETHNLAMMLGRHVGNVRHRVRENAWAAGRGRGKRIAESWAFDIYPSRIRVGTELIPPWAEERYPDLIFDKVSEVSASGPATVHDLVIDDVHNFVAEGTFAHNTSMATPQAAGLGVLARQLYKAKVGVPLTNTEFKAMLAATGPSDPNTSGYGLPTWGRVLAYIESQYGVSI